MTRQDSCGEPESQAQGRCPAEFSEQVAAAPHPTALRMQILTTEHWSLLASRGLAWNESFSRAAMYLSTLTGAMVALGLVAGMNSLGNLFTVFALVILPVVLFVGIATFVRMSAVNYHDAMTVVGMNRIRGAYLELVPELEPYFVMGTHDDPTGIAVTMAVPPNSTPAMHVISATPFVVNVLNAVVASAIAAIAAVGGFHVDLVPGLVLAGAVFVAMLATQLLIVAGNMRRGRGSVHPLFLSPRLEEPTVQRS
jgi:hypothetical protein